MGKAFKTTNRIREQRLKAKEDHKAHEALRARNYQPLPDLNAPHPLSRLIAPSRIDKALEAHTRSLLLAPSFTSHFKLCYQTRGPRRGSSVLPRKPLGLDRRWHRYYSQDRGGDKIRVLRGTANVETADEEKQQQALDERIYRHEGRPDCDCIWGGCGDDPEGEVWEELEAKEKEDVWSVPVKFKRELHPAHRHKIDLTSLVNHKVARRMARPVDASSSSRFDDEEWEDLPSDFGDGEDWDLILEVVEGREKKTYADVVGHCQDEGRRIGFTVAAV
ncbi:hypothetical protein BT69DRAFT_1339171 [Atractiella rhizophila]|nr:hypothetical protein BT69DRAFT_1339171 [Atractiella rhizophila]